MVIGIQEAGPRHAAGVLALFEAVGSSCYCRYWHFQGDKNAWLERCASAPQENRAELERGLAAGTDDTRGLVAVTPDMTSSERVMSVHEEGRADVVLPTQVIGWMKIAPAVAAPKLYDQRLYRRLPCFSGDRTGVFAVGCALVHPAARRRGVATALVAGAVAKAPSWGASALEAFPRRPREPVSDEELWTGPLGAFTANGFVEVNAFEPYPVLRRKL